jgi:hypothetical protein
MPKVPQRNEPVARALKNALDIAIAAKEITEKDLGHRLAVNPAGISQWRNEEVMDRHLPAWLVPEMCKALGDYSVLDHLENVAGRRSLVFVPHCL